MTTTVNNDNAAKALILTFKGSDSGIILKSVVYMFFCKINIFHPIKASVQDASEKISTLLVIIRQKISKFVIRSCKIHH
ncbi:MAG: hypothetical protein C7K11_07875 [Candidatus Amulumruptor caecigallinarius]|nr:MAG: hypothetical protein C7K11_07875 [Candidatus Amulumruptor caecigallinarius]